MGGYERPFDPNSHELSLRRPNKGHAMTRLTDADFVSATRP